VLTRSHRFIGRDAVKPVLRSGKKLRGDGFSLRYMPVTTSRSRFAVVVSKKVDKRAVVRNRIRRRVYSVCEEYLDRQPPLDVAFIVYDKTLADIPHDRLTQRVTSTLDTVFA